MTEPRLDLTFDTEIEILGLGVETPDALPVIGGDSAPDGYRIGARCCGLAAAISLPFGDGRTSTTICVASTPNPRMLCVCVFGSAYLVRFAGAWEVEELGTFAASDLVACPAAGVLAMVDYVEVIGIDESGVAWICDHISDDQLSVVSLGETFLRLRRYSAPDGCWGEVDLDLPTGSLLSQNEVPVQ